MTTFSAVISGQIDSESPYDTTLAAQMAYNHLAVIEGNSTAHKIQTAAYEAASVDQAALANNSVGQDQLKDGTTSQSVTVNSDGHGNVVLTGGSYSMTDFSANSSGSSTIMFGGSSLVGRCGFYNSGITAALAYINSRYFTASQPYNFGQLFIYALMDNSTKEILGLSVGGDPTWAYNGKTDIRPQKRNKQTGKNYRTEKTAGGILIPDLPNHPAELEQYLKGNLVVEDTSIEITMDYKDRDMNDEPHPWHDNPPEFFVGRTVVLLRPNALLDQGLYDIMKESHANESFNIIENGYINIDTIDIPEPNSPDSVMVVKASWKNTN